MAGVDTSADTFFSPGTKSVTFTGIHRAKGNEAGMVYVVNAQEGNDTRIDLAAVRNRLFTAITRSKAWVRVCGYGPEMEQLKSEFERISRADYKLHFTYPTDTQRDHLRIVHREVDSSQKEEINDAGQAVQRFVEGVRTGRLYKEDLPPELMDQLRDILGQDTDR